MNTATPYGLPAIWLRVNCQCPQCREPGTGERLVPITDLPRDVSVATWSRSGDQFTIVFAPDGHESVFDACWLGKYAPGHGRDGAVGDCRSEDSKRLWSAAEIAAAFPQGSWPLFLADAAHRQACLAAVLRDGFVLLRDVSPEPGTVVEVARHFGFVRELEAGPLIDLALPAGPGHRAFSTLAMQPRTAHPFRDPLPTIEVVHCLEQSDQGGESIIVDGFHVAATLRTRQPDAFAALSGTEVTFAITTALSELRATKPVIGVGPAGRIREIRLDSTLMQPLRMPAADVVAFYDAYRVLLEEISRPGRSATFLLRPGDCLVLDNTRVLLGRARFEHPRRLQLAWADLDGLTSTLAIMRRSRRNGRRYA